MSLTSSKMFSHKKASAGFTLHYVVKIILYLVVFITVSMTVFSPQIKEQLDKFTASQIEKLEANTGEFNTEIVSSAEYGEYIKGKNLAQEEYVRINKSINYLRTMAWPNPNWDYFSCYLDWKTYRQIGGYDLHKSKYGFDYKNGKYAFVFTHETPYDYKVVEDLDYVTGIEMVIDSDNFFEKGGASHDLQALYLDVGTGSPVGAGNFFIYATHEAGKLNGVMTYDENLFYLAPNFWFITDSMVSKLVSVSPQSAIIPKLFFTVPRQNQNSVRLTFISGYDNMGANTPLSKIDMSSVSKCVVN